MSHAAGRVLSLGRNSASSAQGDLAGVSGTPTHRSGSRANLRSPLVGNARSRPLDAGEDPLGPSTTAISG